MFDNNDHLRNLFPSKHSFNKTKKREIIIIMIIITTTCNSYISCPRGEQNYLKEKNKGTQSLTKRKTNIY